MMRKASMDDYIKLLILGPTKSGKTALINLLVDHADYATEYKPTQGVRILEMEKAELYQDGLTLQNSVQAWDVAGDEKFSDCWAAITDGADAAILVVNPVLHQPDDLSFWYDNIVEKAQLELRNVMVVLLAQGEKNAADSFISDFRPPMKIQNCRIFACSYEHDSVAIRTEFIEFVNYLELKQTY